MKNPFFLVLLAIPFILNGCSGSDQTEDVDNFYNDSPQAAIDTSQTPKNINDNTETMSQFDQTAAPKKGEEIIVMSTSQGDIKIRLFPELAPKTVENFVGLAKKGYYDNLTFHRIIPNFMIQGGDPNGNGTGGASLWGSQFEDEFNPNLKNIPGSLSMANAGPNTNGSQFFINQVNNSFLDGKHSVFGQVFEGMGVVEAITKVKTDGNDKPVQPVVMKKVSEETFE